MFTWCAILFVLGIFAFIDSVFNMGEIFRKINSVVFMLTSLALLVRTATKAKQQKAEKYEHRILTLEHELNALRDSQEKMNQPY